MLGEDSEKRLSVCVGSDAAALLAVAAWKKLRLYADLAPACLDGIGSVHVTVRVAPHDDEVGGHAAVVCVTTRPIGAPGS